jgi:hypothetical protein
MVIDDDGFVYECARVCGIKYLRERGPEMPGCTPEWVCACTSGRNGMRCGAWVSRRRHWGW